MIIHNSAEGSPWWTLHELTPEPWLLDPGNTDVVVKRLAEIGAGKRLLELGCGGGRVTRPLAAAGIDTTGLDISPEVLDILAQAPGGDRVTKVVGDFRDMSDVVPEASFDAVYCLFNTFSLLLTADEQRQSLGSIRRVVTAGGSLFLETSNDAFNDVPEDGMVIPFEMSDDWVMLLAREWDPSEKVQTELFVCITETGNRFWRFPMRAAGLEELDDLAGSAGWRVAERTAGWNAKPFTGEEPWVVTRFEAL